ELGGWNIDALCIVADPSSICGDGVLSGAEQCDDGAANGDEPDRCRRSCRLPACGDRVVDGDEECDDGNADDSDGCTSACLLPRGDGGCGCAAGARVPAPAVLLTLLGLWLVSRRRRAR